MDQDSGPADYPRAIIRFDETIRAIWFWTDDKTADMLAAINCIGPGSYTMDWRFRYYRDDKAHDSRDEKTVYRGKADNADEATVIRTIRKALDCLIAVNGGHRYELATTS